LLILAGFVFGGKFGFERKFVAGKK